MLAGPHVMGLFSKKQVPADTAMAEESVKMPAEAAKAREPSPESSVRAHQTTMHRC